MAPTNKVLIGIATQSAEGTPAATPQYRLTVTGADIGPQIETGQREETGATRDGGERTVTQRAAGGGFSAILRQASAPLLYYAVMGAKASAPRGTTWAASTAYALGALVRPTAAGNKNLFEATVAGTSGTTEPTWPAGIGSTVPDGGVTWTNRGEVQNSHTITAGDDQPWLTLWKFWGGVLYERYEDCKIVSAQTGGGAGQNVGDLVGQFGIVGKAFRDVTAGLGYDPYDPAAAAGVLDNTAPIRWYGSSVTRDGTAITGDVDQFQNTVNANQEAAQTNQLFFSKIEPGLRNIEHQYQVIIGNDVSDYKRGAYGSATALTPTDSLVYSETVHNFKDSGGATRLKLTIPRFGHGVRELPVDPNGAMGRMVAGGFADRPSSGSIETLAFYNSTAGY
jgi:hypothetical protein